MKLPAVASLLIVGIFATGCVMGRRTISLDTPTAPTSTASKGTAAVTAVVDNRAFENKPKEPSTPSIDGDVKKMSAEIREVMIGRQRNTYGMAMGDIALSTGQTVPQQVRSLVETGLKSRGYTVTSDNSADTKVDVSIDQFWAWFSPGLFTVSFEARIYCTLTLIKNDKKTLIMIQGNGVNQGQIASNANWKLAYSRAYKDFLEKLASALEKIGF
jgi:Uncharacterized lipoprotein